MSSANKDQIKNAAELIRSAKALMRALDEFAAEYGLAILRGASLSSTAAGEFASLMRTSALLEEALGKATGE